MIVNNVTEKIEKLRKFRPDWDSAALDRMGLWETAVNKLISGDDYANLEITKEIVAMLKGFVISINRKLLAVADIPDRAAIIADKNRCLWLLRLICRDYQAEINAIEEDVDFELEGLTNH